MGRATDTPLFEESMGILACPCCGAPLTPEDEGLACTGSECSTSFPVIRGIPVLIDDRCSVFCVDDFVREEETFFAISSRSRLAEALSRLVPKRDKNLKAKQNYRRLAEELLRSNEGPGVQSPDSSPRVLVLGGSILGAGIDEFVGRPDIDVIESDASFGPRTQLICDAHSIPFADGSLDGVVVQAVLEHVVDPARCVAEIHRVLRPGGVVYSETPFMQQVHGGRYDFTRYTHLGHRRLFRDFDELASGAIEGPGMALAWSWEYFLVGLAPGGAGRRLAQVLARFTAWPLKYLDHLVIDRPQALDAAAGLYFMGRKSGRTLGDEELVCQYRGAIR
jgi:SAM-dependent methyltransferase/uncharacterized protein YbaR (Trm112 family)